MKKSRNLSRRAVLGGGLSGLFIGSTPGLLLARGPEADQIGKIWRVPRGQMAIVNVTRGGMGLAEAVEAIEDWTIPAGARVQIKVDDGDHVIKGTLRMRHPDGARIAIVGNTAEPGRARILSEGGFDLIYVGQNHTLGFFDGFTVEQTAPGARALGAALCADEGGMILTGEKVRIVSFYYGFAARRNGIIRCGGTRAERAGDCNYFAFLGGTISAQRAVAVGASDPAKNLGSGFVAEYGGSIDCAAAVSSYNRIAGFTALSGGAIRAYESTATKNGYAGYYATAGGTIVAHDGTSESNCGKAIVEDKSGSFHASRVNERSNQLTGNACVLRITP